MPMVTAGEVVEGDGGGRPERERGGDLCDGVEAEGPGEGVALPLTVYLLLSPSPLSLALSLPILVTTVGACRSGDLRAQSARWW